MVGTLHTSFGTTFTIPGVPFYFDGRKGSTALQEIQRYAMGTNGYWNNNAIRKINVYTQT